MNPMFGRVKISPENIEKSYYLSSVERQNRSMPGLSVLLYEYSAVVRGRDRIGSEAKVRGV
jgi:hypothetical protein